jgi:hypothetical protein
MSKISDPELMAYADGVLPRHLRPLVRQALLRDPELLEKLESYIITNRGLAAPFARLPPVPDRVRQMLASGDAAPRRGGLFPLLLRSITEAKLAVRAALPAWSLAAVALFAAAAVLAGGFWFWGLPGLPRPADGENAGRVSAAQMQRALERTQSNVAAPLAMLTPTGTFLSTENEWCRQYQLSGDEGRRVVGVACRGKGGAWQVKTSALARNPERGNGYAAAGADASEAQEPAAIETMLLALMKDIVLLPADERKLIAGGWQLPR